MLVGGYAVNAYGYGLEALLVNKRSTKRLKDAADVEELERLRLRDESE